MQRHLLLISCMFAIMQFWPHTSRAQRTGWSTQGHVGFVFEISNREAQKLLTRRHSDSTFSRLMHTQVDTFNAAKGWTRKPDKGHFIVARIVENEVQCEYVGVLPYQVFLLREYNSLTLQVVDRGGDVRGDAKVKLRNERIPFDSHTKTYRISDAEFRGEQRMVTVEVDGFRSFFEVIKRERPYWAPSYYHDEGPRFYSYMITDKNRYRPGDKVRFKSYALSRSRRPLQKSLQLWLIGLDQPIRLGIVDAHRPGSYADEFVLHDSLKLKLDKHYQLELRDSRSWIVANSSFTYEDYELNGDKLDVQLESNEQFFPAENKIVMRATDVNGLPLSDARARILIRPRSVSGVFQPVLYLPDTLLYVEKELAFASETELSIPAGLFGKANVSYAVDVTLVSSTNKQLSKTMNANFHYRQYAVDIRLRSDSIEYSVMNNGISMGGMEAVLTHDDQPGMRVILPYREKINPTIADVSVSTAVAEEKVHMERLLPRIDFVGGFEKDTFKVSIVNPHHIPVSWFVYRGTDLLEKGFGSEVLHRSLITDRSLSYYVELVYTFANKERIRQREYRFNDKALDVNLQLADRVYPGQTVDAVITVADQQGAPVSGVDLTALAVNNKLDYFPGDLSDYGTLSSQRDAPTQFDKRSVNTVKATIPLDFKRWARRAGLDTMKYYQMLYPGRNMFTHEMPIADSTQFSVYVMRNGQKAQAYVIEVDRIPVYYSWVNAPIRYSHYVAPNRLSEVTVRLWDRVLIFDSLCFSQGQKTILSIDLDKKPGNVQQVILYPEPGKRRQRTLYSHFTDVERARYSKYVAGFKGSEFNAYLMTESQFAPLGNTAGGQVTAGPIVPGKQTFVSSQLSFNYRFIGGYSYTFEDGVVYREPGVNLLPKKLYDQFQKPSWTMDDLVLNKKDFLATRSVSSRSPWITRSIEVADRRRRLSISLPKDENKTGVYAVLFQHPTTGTLISTCPMWNNHSALYILPTGRFHVIVVYNDGSYLKMDDVTFNSGIHVYVDFNESIWHAANESSEKWRQEALGNCFDRNPPHVTVQQESRRYSSVGNVRGTILDDAGFPMPGVNIVIKGTNIGAVTDVDGNFSLDVVNGYGELVISFVGYTTSEIEVRPGASIKVQMAPDIQQLSEVVVTGYGVQTRKEMTGSVTSVLQGRAPGVQVTNLDEADLSSGQKDEIDEAEAELYRELLSLSGIRANFTDVAIWEPKLFTDKKGRAKFTVTFPDDITQWDATVLAMNRRLQTGVARLAIRSFKPIMAQLDVPRFMVVGDSANAHGMVSNYSSDKSISGNYRWEGPGISYDSGIHIGPSGKYFMPLQAAGRDSIAAKFVFRRDDGYTDGEVRSIPLIPQGTIRASGTLSVFAKGDNKLISTDVNERTTVEIVGGAINVWAGEAQYLIDYRYACNEQLASKLLGLLAHRNIMRFEEKKFTYDYYVKDIIRRLLKNQNDEFLWSWWNVSSSTSYWVSAHILRALKAAKDAGYRVDLDVSNIARKASYKFEMLQSFDYHDADLLQALADWGSKLDYARYVTRIDTLLSREERLRSRRVYWPCSLLRERLLLMEVRQLAGLPFDHEVFTKFRKTGIRGEIYLSDGRECRNWYSDDLSVNSVAYRIVRRDSTLRELLLPMQLYFLSRRAADEWNTYQSANVLISVLPDLLSMGATKSSPVSIVATTTIAEGAPVPAGATRETQTYKKLPIKMELQPNRQLTLTMDSGLPVYVMAYKKEVVTKAAASTSALKISTKLGDGRNLVAGTKVIMSVDVTVTKDAKAEYVMIEIPIPAACSYTDNKQTNWNETHREYFKDRVNIYYENLKVGKHHFEVELLPRFSGAFHVNPAQVSLMYAPVVNANNDMRRVVVSKINQGK